MYPTRKIGLGRAGSLRAAHPSRKAGNRAVQLESALERDFCCLLEFDRTVSSYLEQPVTIEYEQHGTQRRYTPDFLVRYVDARPPLLVEVKYRADLRANWATLRPKFRAAQAYAASQGWEGRLYSEVEIRTPYLRNVKFLLRFQHEHAPDRSEYAALLLDWLAQLDESTPEELLVVVFRDPDRRAELLPVLWHLVGSGLIGCNLLQPLTMRSTLWSLSTLPTV